MTTIFQRLTLSAFLISGLLAMTDEQVSAQDAIYDEAQIPVFTLPDPLTAFDGSKIASKSAWEENRRPEVYEVFAREMYGRAPAAEAKVSRKLISQDEQALDGKAIREEIDITLEHDGQQLTMRMLVFRPKMDKKVPAFLGLNFGGNHSVHPDSGISLNENWMRNNADRGYVDNKATEKTRGASASRWPVETIVGRGYALATIYYGDIDPDFDDGFDNGVHALFRDKGDKIAPDAWGSIAGWAWGLSRALDVLQESDSFDGKRVAVIGHSRLGKTSLWAGASDPRFALVISNDSGCGGAALSRRRFGESVQRINTSFPHWFCDNFLKYNHNEGELPVDQHELIALMAPRPVYVASAVEDQWADPHGEFLSCVYADPVYRLLGTDGMGGDKAPAEMPAVDHPIKSGTIGYHIRTGKHDVTDFDWAQYLDFADRHLK